jgi:hypothetical protein
MDRFSTSNALVTAPFFAESDTSPANAGMEDKHGMVMRGGLKYQPPHDHGRHLHLRC